MRKKFWWWDGREMMLGWWDSDGTVVDDVYVQTKMLQANVICTLCLFGL